MKFWKNIKRVIGVVALDVQDWFLKPVILWGAGMVRDRKYPNQYGVPGTAKRNREIAVEKAEGILRCWAEDAGVGVILGLLTVAVVVGGAAWALAVSIYLLLRS